MMELLTGEVMISALADILIWVIVSVVVYLFCRADTQPILTALWHGDQNLHQRSRQVQGPHGGATTSAAPYPPAILHL